MKPTSLFDKVEKVASSLYLCALGSSAKESVMFRNLIDFHVDECKKPLLVLGHAHPSHGDGSCIAILNPDESLVRKIIPGCGYSSFILKGIVARKCDLALSLWINTDDGFNIWRMIHGTRYKCRESVPAKFTLPAIKLGEP